MPVQVGAQQLGGQPLPRPAPANTGVAGGGGYGGPLSQMQGAPPPPQGMPFGAAGSGANFGGQMPRRMMPPQGGAPGGGQPQPVLMHAWVHPSHVPQLQRMGAQVGLPQAGPSAPSQGPQGPGGA